MGWALNSFKLNLKLDLGEHQQFTPVRTIVMLARLGMDLITSLRDLRPSTFEEAS